MKPTIPLSGLLLTALMLAACQSTPLQATPTTLTVFAAASLNDSFKEIGKVFETANPGAKVTFSFAGSQSLRTQIQQGASADVFASADNSNMDPLQRDNLLASVPQVFARNVLTVILPKNNTAGISILQDLAKPGVKLIFADNGVPVGSYTLLVLDKLSADPTFGADFKTRVLARIVSKETDVKAIVSKVSLGEGDAGVVYATDAKVAVDRLSTLTIPDAYNVIATYPIAVLKTSPNSDAAQKFVDFVLSNDGQSVLKKYGFATR
ncbi:MAG: molybdate ABC transporter substrate-binding protein [Acidobacteriota bacterium]